MHRYLALIANPLSTDSVEALRHIESKVERRSREWAIVHRDPSALIAHGVVRPRHVESYPLPADGGVIVGTLFRRESTPRRPIVGDDIEGQQMLTTRGRHLIEHYWGNYVAFLYDASRNCHYVIRDPTANLACYHTRWNGIEILFSHIEDCAAIVPVRFSINTKAVAAHLLTGRPLSRSTGLNEVDDVPGGERLTICQGMVTRTLLWDPTEFCRAADLDDPARAAKELRSVVQTTVDSWASCCENILHNLSGGLDSSIVAGCLAWTPSRPHVTCLNLHAAITQREEPFTVPTLDGRDLARLRRVATDIDERRFAQLVANRWGYSLIEHERTASAIDLSAVWSAPLATRPSSYVNVIDIDAVELRLAHELEADAVFSGLAGDSVFYVCSHPIGAIDYVWRHGLATGVLQELWKACAISRESVWHVAAKAFRHGLLHRRLPPRSSLLDAPHLLVSDLVSTLHEEDFAHPWESLAYDLPPGKQAHVRGVARALFYEFAFERERHVPSVIPLAAQPVVETCLRIPSYTLLANGVSRGLARQAFQHMLPLEIARRIGKANGTPFYQRLARINMDFLRESLLDGVLIHEGFLDGAQLNRYLIPDQRFMTIASTQILLYLSTEAWLRQWSGVQRNAARYSAA